MTEELFLEWISKIWALHAKKFKRSLLILDLFSAHKCDKVKDLLQSLNTNILFIPSGLTSILQPLDLYINKPLKTQMTQQWELFIKSDYAKKNHHGKIFL